MLRMQSLVFNGSGGDSVNGKPSGTGSSNTQSVAISKKRKLLLSHNSEQNGNKSGDNSKDPVEQTDQSTQNILHQLNLINKSLGSATSSTYTATTNTASGQLASAFPCTSCHKTFATEVDLKAHLIRHLTQHPFVCVACGKGFKYEHSLNFHIKSYHSNNGKDWNGCSGGEKCATKIKHSESESNDLTSLKSSKRTRGDDHRKGGVKKIEDSEERKSLMTLVDENHNHARVNLNNNQNGPDMSYFLGKPPTNFPPDSTIQIRSEKVLISLLDAVNVATDQSMLFYKCCLCCVAFPALDQMNLHIQNVHSLVDGATVDSIHFNPYLPDADCKYQCDKCAAKFQQRLEYEIHCELHRTLDTNNSGSQATAATTNGVYPFSLLEVNPYANAATTTTTAAASPQVSSSTSSSNLVDFRQLLAKDTDFGRKFAAQLLDSSNQSCNDDCVRSSSSSEKFPPSTSIFDRCSPPPLNGKLNDSNNNSLLYMSLLPEHGSSVPSSVVKSKNYPKYGTEGQSKSLRSSPSVSKSKLLSSPKSSGTPRHLKEPVDIFEGAGQSLPIEKFPLGDIEETAPGQFKCRFCDKTFDRVFSVHRHERVHTGFKPCICKTCGRGFSEKRNLRHHIIRFHSDGSGRELLKRKRKPRSKMSPDDQIGGGGGEFGDKSDHQSGLFLSGLNADPSLSPTASPLMMANNKMSNSFISLLNAALRAKPNEPHSPTATTTTTTSPKLAETNESFSNLKMSLDELNRSKPDDDEFRQSLNGSRRRKSKPSKKVYNSEQDDDDDDDFDEHSSKRELKKEMLIVDVDVHPLEDDTEASTDEADKPTVVRDSEGDETETNDDDAGHSGHGSENCPIEPPERY